MRSCFFNSINKDRVYNAEIFAEYFATFIGNGIFGNKSDNLQVLANDNMKISIQPGKCWINGYLGVQDIQYNFIVDPGDNVLNRIDRIVAYLDLIERKVDLKLKKGEYATEPVAREVIRDGSTYELSLATIYINKASVTITQADITDTRLDNSVCGIVHGLVDQVDTTTLFNQYQTWLNNKKTEFDTDLKNYKENKKNEIDNWFGDKKNEWESWYNTNTTAFFNAWNEWFEGVKNIFDGDVAGNIINKIDKVDKKVDKLNNKVDTTVANLNQKMTEIVNAHSNKTVNSKEGIHGFRFFEDSFQCYDDAEKKWVDIESGSGLPPDNVSNFIIHSGNGKLTIKWSDPRNTIVEGQTLSTWAGTKLVYKAGSYPENIKDGIVAVDNKERDKYKYDGFVINGLTNGTAYYFQLFPYSDKKAVNSNSINRDTAIPNSYKVMTVKVDMNNPNPFTSVTYHDDAENMNPASNKWDDFFGHYPCLFKDGQEVGKLNPNDFTKFENGNLADIESGTKGDVMICFPLKGICFNRNGNILTVKMTDELNNPDFQYYAHTTDDNVVKDKVYIGAFLGHETHYSSSATLNEMPNNKIRSLTNKYIMERNLEGNLPVGDPDNFFSVLCKRNGENYDAYGFYQHMFIQVMYLLKYKNLNSKKVIGIGLTNNRNTGGTESKGMDYGTQYTTDPIKLFGIEGLWGATSVLLKGLRQSNGKLITKHGNYNNGTIRYYFTKVVGNTEFGFVPTGPESSGGNAGSSTTYFCDYSFFYEEGNKSICTGNSTQNTNKAIFSMIKINNNATNGVCRLIYL